MGYYTRYELEWGPLINDECIPQCEHFIPDGAKFCPECGEQVRLIPVGEKIRKFLRDNKEKFYGIDEDGDSIENCKWYDHTRDMKEMSALFPLYVFTLSGEGEEAGDLWKEYHVNGKVQTAKATITYEDFDPTKLK